MSVESLTNIERTGGQSAFGVARFYGTTAPDPNLFDEWVFTTTGRVRRHDGVAWFEESIGSGGSGLTAPQVRAQNLLGF